jgi:hypothetical protein
MDHIASAQDQNISPRKRGVDGLGGFCGGNVNLKSARRYHDQMFLDIRANPFPVPANT